MDSTLHTTSTDAKPSASELIQLSAQTAWACNRQEHEVEDLLRDTDLFVTVRKGDRLVGFGRALSDGVFRALVDDIIVDQSCRNEGIGGHMIEVLMEKLSDIEEVFLNCGEQMEEFYKRFGFKKFNGLTMKAEPRAASDS
jgi:predicted GNAT family N-acyltransferase